jgi:hypothetical protein
MSTSSSRVRFAAAASTTLQRHRWGASNHTGRHPDASSYKETAMKYMIMTLASQLDYQQLAGQASGQPAWNREEWAALAAFMDAFNQELLDSGELVETRGLSAPVHARRVHFERGVPVVTDGPYAEAEEVLAGYWVVDCASFDRATEIAARLADCPGPEHVRARAYLDVRPIDEHQPDFEG